MTQFDESKVNRDGDGKFASKGPAPEGDATSLSFPAYQEPAPVVRSFEDVSDEHDGYVSGDYSEADTVARKVADEGYLAVVHAVSHYDEDDVADGGVPFTDQSYEVKVFEHEEDMTEWAEREGMGMDETRPDRDVFNSVDPYRDPYGSSVEVHEGFIRRPQYPAIGRMNMELMAPEELRVGDTIEWKGRARKIISMDNDHRSTSIEVDEEVFSVSNEDPVRVLQPYALSESELTRRFDPEQKPSGDFYDREEIADEDPHMVWTVVEGDGTDNAYALPGVHRVNAYGYLKGARPWPDELENHTAGWDVNTDPDVWRERREEGWEG